MKLALIGFLTFFSVPAFAGDLNLNCFINSDPGQYVNEPTPFVDAHRASQIIETDQQSIVVLVRRDSLFTGYRYQIFQIDKDSSAFQERRIVPTNYSTWVEVGQGLHCHVID